MRINVVLSYPGCISISSTMTRIEHSLGINKLINEHVFVSFSENDYFGIHCKYTLCPYWILILQSQTIPLDLIVRSRLWLRLMNVIWQTFWKHVSEALNITFYIYICMCMCIIIMYSMFLYKAEDLASCINHVFPFPGNSVVACSSQKMWKQTTRKNKKKGLAETNSPMLK